MENSLNVATNLEKLMEKITKLAEVLDVLNKHGIKYGLYAGSHVAVLTSNRTPTDVDFLVADEDVEKLKAALPQAEYVDKGHFVFLYPDQGKDIEFMAKATIKVGGSEYEFRLTPLVWQHRDKVKANEVVVNLCNPVDTMLLKAMLQRGLEVGKHDLQDIEAILKKIPIDKEYLRQRLKETGQDERLLGVLRKYHLIA